MELLIFIILVSLFFPGSGGGHFDGAGILAGILAGIFGFAIIGAILYANGWAIYQMWVFVLGEPVPGSNAAAVFLLTMMVGPILGLFALCRIAGYFDTKYRARLAMKDHP